jgi:hypothetical protein
MRYMKNGKIQFRVDIRSPTQLSIRAIRCARTSPASAHRALACRVLAAGSPSVARVCSSSATKNSSLEMLSMMLGASASCAAPAPVVAQSVSQSVMQ